MSVTIEIDAPQLLPQLLAGLEAGGCSAALVNSHACRVVHAPGGDGDAELCELRFYVRAWAHRLGGVGVRIESEA